MDVTNLVQKMLGTNAASVGDSPTKSNLPDQKYLADLTAKYDILKNQRIGYERQWYTNLAFFAGRQYVSWITQGQFSRLYEPPVPAWRVRMVVNKCKVIVRTELAKMTKERARGYVVPSTGDDEDRSAARVADQIYEYLYHELQLGYELEKALFWVSTCGLGFQKIYYDKNKKDFSGALGSIVIEPISPFHIRVPDSLEIDIEKQAYVIHETAKPIKDIEKIYGLKLSPDAASKMPDGNQVRFSTALGITAELNKTMVSVREIWIKPCIEYPEGVMATFTKDYLLQYQESWPYDHGMYPFVKYEHIPTGKFYTDSTLVDAIPIQKEINRTISQIIEAKNKTSKPAMLVSTGSVDPNKITSEPGLIIEYRPGTAVPTIMEPPTLPSYVINILDWGQNQLNDISSQHEVSKGSTPPGVTAGTAIAFLQEEDDSKLSQTIASIERGVQKTGKQLLGLVNQFWAEDRQIKIVGEDMAYELRMYSQDDVKGNTDFRVEIGSATPRSRAAKQAFIMELMDRGLQLNEALKYLDMAETNKLYDDAQVDARAAAKENSMFATGEIQSQWDRNDWDDDIKHIEGHETFQKKETFDTMPPEQKSLLSQHVRVHKYHIAAKFGRMDLLPMPDPMTGQLGADNPMLDGFIAGLKSGAIPMIIPPPPPSPGHLAMDAHQSMPGASNGA